MAVRIDLTGEIYGKLKVVGIAFDEPGKKKKWNCICECGNTLIVSASNLRSGHTKFCKECRRKYLSELNTIHGLSNTPIYLVWNTMLSRCERQSNRSYSDYGGKGIKVCDEWHNAAVFFKWAYENGYKPGLEIDRIDSNGDYTPGNCRFVTRLNNANNKTNNKYIEHNGEIKTLAEWSRYFGVNYKNLSRNLKKGYSLEESVDRQKNGERTHKGSKKWNKNRE